MASSPDKLLSDLTAALLDSSNGFSSTLPAVEKQMYARVLELMADLDKSNGRLKISAKNIRIIGQIRRELNAIILTPKYRKAVQDFVDSFDAIEKLQIGYFDTIVDGYKPNSVMKALKAETIEAVKGNMLDVGIQYNISQRIADTLRQQVTSGGKYSDLVDNIRETMVGDGQGALQKYANTYANDALYTYSRQYNTIFTEDAGIEWYQWGGGLQDTSREFCKAMEKASRAGGCLEYIHVSQFDELISGNVCGDRVPINPKTDLPDGFKKGTNPANFITNVGGWNCRHELMPVSDAVVPERFKEKIQK